MSIQVYVCPVHGKHEVFIRRMDIPQMALCPGCGKPTHITISAPAIINVQETWNDTANRCRVNPYDQAKEQLKNHDREQQEYHDARPMKITDEQIQVVAKGIDETDRRPPLDEGARAARQIRDAKKRDKQKKKES
jgi:hypothetical protein